jgi:hypothetical protein
MYLQQSQRRQHDARLLQLAARALGEGRIPDPCRKMRDWRGSRRDALDPRKMARVYACSAYRHAVVGPLPHRVSRRAFLVPGGVVVYMTLEDAFGADSICEYFDLLTPERALELLQLGSAQRALIFEEPVSGETALRECAV